MRLWKRRRRKPDHPLDARERVDEARHWWDEQNFKRPR
jgi:hypothetical protein